MKEYRLLLGLGVRILSTKNKEGLAHILAKKELAFHINVLGKKECTFDDYLIKNGSVFFGIAPFEEGDVALPEYSYYNIRPDITIMGKSPFIHKTIIEIIDTHKKDFAHTLRYVEDDDLNVLMLRTKGLAHQGSSRLPLEEDRWSSDFKYFVDIDKIVMGWRADMPKHEKMHIAYMEADRGTKDRYQFVQREGDYYLFGCYKESQRGNIYPQHRLRIPINMYNELKNHNFKVSKTDNELFKKEHGYYDYGLGCNTWTHHDSYYRKPEFMLAYIATELDKLENKPKWRREFRTWDSYAEEFYQKSLTSA